MKKRVSAYNPVTDANEDVLIEHVATCWRTGKARYHVVPERTHNASVYVKNGIARCGSAKCNSGCVHTKAYMELCWGTVYETE